MQARSANPSFAASRIKPAQFAGREPDMHNCLRRIVDKKASA